MANIKQYKIDYNGEEAEICVEIDHDKVTEEMLHEINNFWSQAEYRLAEADGNILQAVLVQLGQVILWKQLESDLNISGLINAFDWDNRFSYDSALEGWPKMDGSTGFKLIRILAYEFSQYDFNVAEIQSEETAK